MTIKALTTLDMLEKVIIDIEDITKDFCDNYCKYGVIEDDVPTCTHEGTCRLMDELGNFGE